jgi:hypothetical protein
LLYSSEAYGVLRKSMGQDWGKCGDARDCRKLFVR